MSWTELYHDCNMPSPDELLRVGPRERSWWECDDCGREWVLRSIGDNGENPEWKDHRGPRRRDDGGNVTLAVKRR